MDEGAEEMRCASIDMGDRGEGYDEAWLAEYGLMGIPGLISTGDKSRYP
jgi:hypothetical protein